VNGRRARALRRSAETLADQPDGYQPQVMRDAEGKPRAIFPDVRLVPGCAKSIARKTRRKWPHLRTA
jgi:hypothetical protein